LKDLETPSLRILKVHDKVREPLILANFVLKNPFLKLLDFQFIDSSIQTRSDYHPLCDIIHCLHKAYKGKTPFEVLKANSDGNLDYSTLTYLCSLSIKVDLKTIRTTELEAI
jgi:hypothetical protein